MQRASWVALNSPVFDPEIEEALAFWRHRCERFGDPAAPGVRLCLGVVPLAPVNLWFTRQTVTDLRDVGTSALEDSGNCGFVHGGIAWYTVGFPTTPGRRIVASDQGWLECVDTAFQSRDGWFFLNWVEKPVESLIKLTQATLGSTEYADRVVFCLTLVGADQVVLKSAQAFGEYRFREASTLEVAAIAEDCTPEKLEQAGKQLVRRFSRAYGWPAFDA
ncbi:MAG TPA: hypothetical protein VNT26_20580 [Candidatus Sulfotelmatobacter sp.]|nr:hypothetical protein [Candidatus Sulfotelmatobacter sp.]